MTRCIYCHMPRNLDSKGRCASCADAGDCAKIGSSGNCAKINCAGTDSVICCAGRGSVVKAPAGCWITLAEWKYDGKKAGLFRFASRPSTWTGSGSRQIHRMP